MSETTAQPGNESKQQRMGALLAKLLPLVDVLADKVRLFVILNILSVIWLVVWSDQFKHFSTTISVVLGLFSLLPGLILARFWWALTELKDLPEIAGQMVGDAKGGLHASLAQLKAGQKPKLGLFGAGKSLWSIGSMMADVRDLFGSYLGIVTLANPFMLMLGVIVLFSVFFIVIAAIILAFFAI